MSLIKNKISNFLSPKIKLQRFRNEKKKVVTLLTPLRRMHSAYSCVCVGGRGLRRIYLAYSCVYVYVQKEPYPSAKDAFSIFLCVWVGGRSLTPLRRMHSAYSYVCKRRGAIPLSERCIQHILMSVYGGGERSLNPLRKMCCIAMNNYTYTYSYACRNITTQWRRAATVLIEKYTSHFIWKGCVWEGVGDWTELQHIDPHSYGHNSVSFPFSWAAQLGAWGPSLSGTWFSIQHLISNCNCSIGGLRALSAGCWFSLPHLISNWLELPVAGLIS